MDKQGHKASRTIEVTVLSAENLRLDRKSVKKNTYVIARAGPLNSGSTKADFEGGSNPSWNEKITLDLPFQTRFISLEVKCKTSSGDRVIGTASLPISDILEDYTPENHLHFLSYRLKDSRGGRNGVINVSARVQMPVDSVCPSATKNPSGYGCSSSWQQPALGVPVGHQQNYYSGVVTGVPVKKCTNNFSQSNEIGSGGYGKVYRGTLSDGQVVAIKRAQKGSMQGGLEFKTEIELLSRVHHKNLVGLVGFGFEQGEQMLVYEYMPNGTLRESLSGKSGIYLDWKRRLRIALGSARGLTYLHELADPPIIHRDVKTTNILLDENLTAKVADFGLSKLVSDISKGHVSTQVKGTLGYLDPEYYMTQQLTEKSDVYSFGVVMLELIIAKQPIEKGKYIVREVRMTMDRDDQEHHGLKEIMDPGIRNMGNLVGFRRFLELAMQCVEESATERPPMSEVVKEIEMILKNDGMNTNSTTSASSSATDFGASGAGPLRHPYNDVIAKNKDVNSVDNVNHDAFDHSGGSNLSGKAEST